MTRVLVVDDHPIVRSGLSALIDADPGLSPVGTAGNVAETLALATDLDPDVCVIDLHLPDGDGISLGRLAKQRWPGTRVLILTMSSEPAAVLGALGAGLDGYVLKDSDPEELLSAIRSTAAGAVVLGRGASAPVLAAASAVPSIDGSPGADPLAALDSRDREILALLVRGRTTSQVASVLFLAPKTIRNRVSDILGKLGVTSREEAVDLARSHGLGT